MRRSRILWVLAALLSVGSAPALADAGDKAPAKTKAKTEKAPAGSAEGWIIDTSHSTAGFKVRHMMVSTTPGTFSDVRGTVMLDPKKASESKVEATIRVASIDTGDRKRDDHLRSKDFFDAKKFPTMTFKSTKVRKIGRKYRVEGDLTIKGTTRPVTLKVSELTKPIRHPMAKVWARGARATAEIDRTEFGLTWNKTLDKGGFLIGKKVEIALELELHKDLE